MKQLIEQLSLMIEEMDCDTQLSEHMKGQMEGLRIAIHMAELSDKLSDKLMERPITTGVEK